MKRIFPKLNITYKRCILSCQDGQKLFGFPEELVETKLWLEKLGFTGVPLTSFEMNVCLNHFSSRQLTKNGFNLASGAYPDKNIPGKEDEQVSDNEPEIPPAPFTVDEPVKPKKTPPKTIPQKPKRCVMITSAASDCILKCKTYSALYKFPTDLSSFRSWLHKLGFDSKTPLSRNALLCNNHFSPAMRTPRAITKSAVPDLYLPPQCQFINELEAPLKKSIFQTVFDACGKTNKKSLIIGDSKTPEPSKIPAPKSIPIALNSGFQRIGNVVCPANGPNAPNECVLKCKDSKVLFRFPSVESKRKLWLSKVGLTHCFCTSRICNRHFSEKMFANSHKKILGTAYPDINLPELTIPPTTDNSIVVREIPQYISILTVITENKKLNTSNNSKYIKFRPNKRMPMRERSVQVTLNDFVEHADKAILADEDVDEDADEEMEIEENINIEEENKAMTTLTTSQVFPSRSKDMFECLKCGEITIDPESIERHLDLHRVSSYLCLYCGQKFSSGLKLKRHEFEMHVKEMKQMLRRCPMEHCKKAFHSRKNFYQHLDQHAKPPKHYCSNCGRLFFSSLKLNCHMLACRPRLLRTRIK